MGTQRQLPWLMGTQLLLAHPSARTIPMSKIFTLAISRSLSRARALSLSFSFTLSPPLPHIRTYTLPGLFHLPLLRTRRSPLLSKHCGHLDDSSDPRCVRVATVLSYLHKFYHYGV